MYIETRAGRLLCGMQIKYLPLRMCSGEDDKPSLNPSGEKHRKNNPILGAIIMTNSASFETYSIQDIEVTGLRWFGYAFSPNAVVHHMFS